MILIPKPILYLYMGKITERRPFLWSPVFYLWTGFPYTASSITTVIRTSDIRIVTVFQLLASS